jgi:hypothetical protein
VLGTSHPGSDNPCEVLAVVAAAANV